MTYRGLNNARTFIVHRVWGGGNVEWCPDFYTGPGPQCMAYVEEDDKGFFGEVPNGQLITPVDLTSQLGVTQGISQNTTTPWLKFYLDGKILYVSKKPIRHTIGYAHLRELGLVDRTRIITISDLQYRVGLIKVIDDDYFGQVVNNEAHPHYSLRSEWNRLIYNSVMDVTTPSLHKQDQVGDNWAEYPQDNSTNGLGVTAGNGSYAWGQDNFPETSIVSLFRGVDSVVRIYENGNGGKHYYYGWRPLLELVNE